MKRTHVLVVDDDEYIRITLERAIKNFQCDCSVAKSANDALKVLEEKNVDVVITDIVMQGLDGIELTEIVKEKYDTDVIVMTGFAEDIKYEDIIRKGASDFIIKPVSPKEIIVRLNRVLKERTVIAERNQKEEELKRSFKKLKRVIDQTVKALISQLEKRDPYTAGHQQRVAKIACFIAEEMALSEKCIEGIHIAGLVHDIGKIGVPSEILNKSGKLSKNEFNLVKEHPQIGYDIIKNIEFEQPIAQIILQHHERMNGSGYPQGLSGENIKIEARILAVADVIEACLKHRPYRPALDRDKASDEISINRGILYDTKVVDVCLKLFNDNKFIFD